MTTTQNTEQARPGQLSKKEANSMDFGDVLNQGIPMYAVGLKEDSETTLAWKVGESLRGLYLNTKRVFSHKFEGGNRFDKIRKEYFQDIHVLEDTKTKAQFGIYDSGLLGATLERLRAGKDVIAIRYEGEAADKLDEAHEKAPHAFLFSNESGKPLTINWEAPRRIMIDDVAHVLDKERNAVRETN